jgi:hypothetical protein
MPRANNKKNNKRKRPPLPINGIASRTRRRPKKDVAAAWDIPIPIILEIISWIDQETLVNLSLVSKQMHGIIRNEPGNKNKIISVFEIRGSSTLKLFQNLCGYFMDEKTKKRLQSYHVMTFKDPYRFNTDASLFKLRGMLEQYDIQMNGITSLNFPSSPGLYSSNFELLSSVMKILPKLREVDLSGTVINTSIINELSNNCRLLEKVVISFKNIFSDLINLSGLAMSDSRYLKEIHMNNIDFFIRLRDKDKISDLNNHRNVFIFHHCCKSLERVSILDMDVSFFDDEIDDYEIDYDDDGRYDSTFIQNVLIKFVRNVPSLRWFRSDLTSENMTMLRMERPEIELLN